MTKKQLKKRSKRVSLNTKYKIKKKVREHHRKLRKEAKKAKKNGIAVKSASNVTKIPNLYPNKLQELEDQEVKKETERLEKQRRANGVNDKDIDQMVVEETATVVKGEQEEEISNERKSKNEHKRELNQLTSKSKIVLQVLDARDPLSYRSKELERSDGPNKKIIFLINKADLVSKENLDKWVKFCRRDYPTVPFSVKEGSFFKNGMKELCAIIEQLAGTLSWKENVHVSLVGYPNVGKSSILEKIKSTYSKSVKSLLVSGAREIIIDTTSIRVFDKVGCILSKNEIGPMMPKYCKKVEEVKSPVEALKNLLEVIPHDDLLEMYEIKDFENLPEFLQSVCNKHNFFVKKGFHDMERAARYILSDVIEGKIKYETEL